MSAQTYAIHVVHKGHPIEGFWQRVIFAPERRHSFFILEKEGVPVAELHFTAKNHKGVTAKRAHPLNVMQALADHTGTGRIVNQVIRKLWLSRYFMLLKAVETHSRVPLDHPDIRVYGSVVGDEQSIMQSWNRICALALEINNAQIIFTHNPRWAYRKPASCQAATKTILAKLGSEFELAARNQAQKNGRFVEKEIRVRDRVALPDGVDPEILHQTLKRRLFETSGYRQERAKMGGNQPKIT